VLRIEYDPNRTAFIALLGYKTGVLSYIIAPENLKVGDLLISGLNTENRLGNFTQILNIPIGAIIHNLELYPGNGSILCRSAGTKAQIISKLENGYSLIKLNSGEQRKFSLFCRASLGQVSNIENKHINYGKAGKSRWLGILPTVRGVAKNPVDHPHGGRTKGGRPSVTPWGRPTKGYKTRRNKRTTKFIVQRIN
jgi:large subunit ribosomal protein L2